MFFFILLLFIDWLIYFSFHFSSSFFLRLPFLLSLLLFYLLKLEKTWASFVSCTWQKQSPLHPFLVSALFPVFQFLYVLLSVVSCLDNLPLPFPQLFSSLCFFFYFTCLLSSYRGWYSTAPIFQIGFFPHVFCHVQKV